jgi:hypothetical protein
LLEINFSKLLCLLKAFKEAATIYEAVRAKNDFLKALKSLFPRQKQSNSIRHHQHFSAKRSLQKSSINRFSPPSKYRQFYVIFLAFTPPPPTVFERNQEFCLIFV